MKIMPRLRRPLDVMLGKLLSFKLPTKGKQEQCDNGCRECALGDINFRAYSCKNIVYVPLKC
jgi:hypothetical protein